MVCQGGGKDKKDRPSPSSSATIFSVGFQMTGNDGNLWDYTSILLC